MKQKFYYGWFVTFLSGFGIACSFAVLIPSTLGFLVAPLHREFGWTIQQIMAATVFVTSAGVVVSPFVGAVIDRYGARKVIVISFVLEALIIGSMSRMSDSLPFFYVRFIAFAVLCSGCTAIGFTTLVSKWFDRKRGLALGVALAGTGLGGVLWSFAVSILFAAIGWRPSLMWFAVFLGVVVAPLMYFVLRDHPSDMGLLPDGVRASSLVQKREPLIGLTLREAARTGQFWLLLAVSFLVAFGVQSIMFNLVPIIKQSGDPHHLAGAIQASLWASLVVGRVMTGWLLDKIFAARVAMAFLLFPAAGAALFAGGTNGPMAFVAAMLIGLAAGAEVDTFAYMASRYFGLKYFSRIYGTCFSLFALGAGTGPVITAHIAQRSGSYAPALWMLVGVLILAAITLMFFRRYPALSDQSKKSADFSVSDQPAT
jgi:MFS family permease